MDCQLIQVKSGFDLDLTKSEWVKPNSLSHGHVWLNGGIFRKMALASAEIMVLLLFLWFQLRRTRLRRTRRRRIARWRLMVLAFEVRDQERLLAAAVLLSSRVIDVATVERHSWARQRMTTFFPDIVRTWDDSEFKRNF